MSIDQNTKVFMYGVDGGRREVYLYQKDEMLKKGWVIMRNSNESYRPDLDQTLPDYKKETEEVEESNILEVKIV